MTMAGFDYPMGLRSVVVKESVVQRVYIIYGEEGAYSDYSAWVDSVFLSEEDAVAYAKKNELKSGLKKGGSYYARDYELQTWEAGTGNMIDSRRL